MNALPLLAQSLPSGLVGIGASIAGLVLLYVAYGVWDRNLKPRVLAVIGEWWIMGTASRKVETEQVLSSYAGQQAQVEQRKAEIQSVVSAWHNAPEQVSSRTEFTRKVIDNEVARTDGIIHTSIRTGMGQVVQPLQTDMTEIKSLLTQKAYDDGSFRHEVISRLAHMEGYLSVEERASNPGAGPSRQTPAPYRAAARSDTFGPPTGPMGDRRTPLQTKKE